MQLLFPATDTSHTNGQTAVEDARTAAENVFAFAGHIPVETYAGSYGQTCFGHVRGLIAAVVGESLREVLVLVVVDGGVGGHLETDADRRLEALAEIDLVLQIDRVLHVGELGILLSQRVVVAVGETERQRFAVVLEIVPCLIDVVAGAALQVAVLGTLCSNCDRQTNGSCRPYMPFRPSRRAC